MDRTIPEKVTPQMVSCDVCLKEIPAESEEYFETDDYVQHFCGIDCYKQWKQQQDAED